MQPPTESLSQDTGYVFNVAEARTVARLIDQAFQPNEVSMIEGRRSGTPGYHDAHGKLRTSIASLRGTTVDDLDFLETGANADVPAAHVATEGADVDESVAPLIGDPIRHELDRVFMYELVVPVDGPVKCTLGHYDEESEWAWPPRIESVTDAVADLWEFLAEEVTAAPAVARLHDLAFLRGRNRFAHAVAARDAYLVFAAQSPVVDLDEAHAMLRAWAIDRIFKRRPNLDATRVAIEQAILAAWEAGLGYPGVVLPLLKALCQSQLPADADPVSVDALLNRASSLYAAMDCVGEVAELRRARAATHAERDRVGEWYVERLAENARQSHGFVKAMRLRDAISEAGRLHLGDLERKLTVELQSLPPQDAKLERLTSDLRISRVPIERFIKQFTRHPDWRQGMNLFAQIPPPTGSSEELEKAAEARRLRPLLIDLVSTVMLDGDHLPSWEPTTEEERREYQKARDAGFSAAVAATHLIDILDRFRTRYGVIPVDEIAKHISHEGRGNYELAAVFGRALHHYWNGDIEACIHIAVPRIESAIRLILRELDAAIYRIQLGARPGQYPALGSLLAELVDLGFDDAWVYFLRWLLTEHVGKNLRNEVAHGRVAGTSRADAALVLRALLLVVLLCGPGNADDIEADLGAEEEGGLFEGGKSSGESNRQSSIDSPLTPADELRTLIRQPLLEKVKLPPRGRTVVAHLVRTASSWIGGRR